MSLDTSTRKAEGDVPIVTASDAEALAHADAAMYAAKRAGGGRWSLFAASARATELRAS